jgi:hypothetical protein
MQMPEPAWFTYRLTDTSFGRIRAYEHEVSVLMPWRRYLRDGQPRLVEGSPSEVMVGEETRHGTQLAVRRVSYDPVPNPDLAADLLGELVECWAFMTMEMSTSIDPRWDA